MSYRNPYTDPYSQGTSHTQYNQAGPDYGQNQYTDGHFNYNPYTQPSHPTYDQGGYGAEGYTNKPEYPPQRQPTQRTQATRTGSLHHRKENYPPGADLAAIPPPMKKTASALKQYRYDHQGALWTRGGTGRCVGRFCCCTVMSVLFLLVSIVLALALWIRPPGIIIGDVQTVPQDGSQFTINSDSNGISLTIHLALNITVNNPNYFSVNFKQIKAELFYPINNTAIGGGTANNVIFPANTQTNWTFPFDVQYKSSIDPSGLVLSDLISKCGQNRQSLDISYKITPALRIILLTISPSISNSFSFPCPIDADDIQKIGGNLGSLGGLAGI